MQQGSYIWVLESHGIFFFSFQSLESHGILCRVMESHGKLNHYKNFFIVYHDRQKFHWMYLTELRIISHGKDGKSHGKSHGKSWNVLQLKKYKPCTNVMCDNSKRSLNVVMY